MLLTALPTYRLTAQTSQPITVIAAPGFRARPIQQHQLTFQVAFDTAEGGIIARQLAIGAFTFTGVVRVDGINPFSRTPERTSYGDSARFEDDGRVVLEVADSASRGPILVEPRGVAGANAARLLISAHGWPQNRVVLVTIEPLDLYITASRAGYAVRDRLRVVDPGGVAYLADSTAPPAVVAVALGRGAGGRLQSGLTDLVIQRRFEDGAVVPEHHGINRLVLFVEPERADNGDMHAEILFGLGRSEAEALEAARGGTLDAPPVARLPRIVTPEPDIVLALRQLLGAAAWTGAGAPRPGAADSAWPADQALWQGLVGDARRIITRDYGRADSAAVEAARFRSRVIEGLFGVSATDVGVTVAPRVAGVADDFTWQLEGFPFGNDDVLNLAYRPADRSATINVRADRRVRLELRFPWLSAESCVAVRRGRSEAERLPVVQMRNGWIYADVRSGFDPATVTVSAAGCRG